jgi:hypothetical protein
LTGCVATTLEPADVPPTTFEIVCERVVELGYSCEGIDPPVVIYSRITSLIYMGVIGVYIPGEKYVFVDPNGPWQTVTEIHEIAHYVLWFQGVTDRCESEGLARKVARQTQEWRTQYGCLKETEDVA